MTIEILAIQIVTERPWSYAARDNTAISSPLPQGICSPGQRSQSVTAPHKVRQSPVSGGKLTALSGVSLRRGKRPGNKALTPGEQALSNSARIFAAQCLRVNVLS